LAGSIVSKACEGFVSLRLQAVPSRWRGRVVAYAQGFGRPDKKSKPKFDEWNERTEDLEAERAFHGRDPMYRNVEIDDIRDLNELLRVPNPLSPTAHVDLVELITEDGRVIKMPTVKDLKKCNPTEIRPITLRWKDYREDASVMKSPKQYEEMIARLLNSGDAEIQEIVRNNWKYFDKSFYFFLTELIEDATDPRMKEKLTTLNKYTLEILQTAQDQIATKVPDEMEDAKKIMDALLEDGEAIWPPTAEGWARMAEEVQIRAVRKQYADGWFETMLEACERFGLRAQNSEKEEDKVYVELARASVERLVTEWLRHDSLWEETVEGKFVFKLMNLHQRQWRLALQVEVQEQGAPLDAYKIREELKIISETRVVSLPMGSKIQAYAAQYLQGIVNFVSREDELLVNGARQDASPATR